jgi:pyruvate formate lyase activating enzyme
MKLTTLIPETFQEFEDQCSIVLYCFGCNLRCSFCYNYDFVTNPVNIMQESAEELIDKHVSPMIDGLVFLGGEPTLYPERLREISVYAKQKYGLAVKLFTNGTNPSIVFEGLQSGWLDKVSIDYKTSRDTSIYLNSRDPHDSVRLLLDRVSLKGLQNKVEVRTTVFGGMSDDDLGGIKDYCNLNGLTHIVQQEVDYKKWERS